MKTKGISRKTKHEISYEIINLFSNEMNIALLQIRSKKSSHTNAYTYIYLYIGPSALLPRPAIRVSDYMFLFSIEITSCVSSVNMPRPQCREREIEIAVHDEKEDKMQRSGSIWIYIVIGVISAQRLTCLCLFGFYQIVCFCCKYQENASPHRVQSSTFI